MTCSKKSCEAGHERCVSKSELTIIVNMFHFSSLFFGDKNRICPPVIQLIHREGLPFNWIVLFFITSVRNPQ